MNRKEIELQIRNVLTKAMSAPRNQEVKMIADLFVQLMNNSKKELSTTETLNT